MAISYLQSAHGNAIGAGTVTTAAFGSSTVSGNAILVAVCPFNNTLNRISSVTDSKGNTYLRAISQPGTVTLEIEIWYSLNIVGGASHTVTGTSSGGTDTLSVVAQEFSGLLAFGALDQVAGNNGTGTTPDSGSTAITNQANELIFGAAGANATGGMTVGAGYSNFDTVGGAVGPSTGAESKIVSSLSTYNATFGSSNVVWAAAIATFKGIPTGNLTLLSIG